MAKITEMTREQLIQETVRLSNELAFRNAECATLKDRLKKVKK